MDLENSRLTRRGFVALTGATSLGALLAACGGGDGGEAEPAAPETGAQAGETTPAAVSFDPAAEPDGPITFFEWAGYDKTSPWMWEAYTKGEYGQRSPLKFEFLENDIQALAKVASGYSPDVIHPCIAYWPDWHAAGLIQPFDKALLPDYEGIPASIRDPGVGEDGLVYHVPFDIGFSALVYRADKIPITPEEESWSILLDPAYEGKLATFSDPITIIKIGALINAGEPIDPNKLTTEQIEAAKETMIQAKPQIRNFWSGNQDNINDFINGNVWATYMWPDGYLQAIRHEKLKGVDVRYMWPKEGRLAWVCGFVLNAATEQPGRSTLAVAAANTPLAAASLTDVFAYGAAQQEGVLDLIKDKELISIFSLDDPTAFEPPRAWFEQPLPNRQEYAEAGEAVKAA